MAIKAAHHTAPSPLTVLSPFPASLQLVAMALRAMLFAVVLLCILTEAPFEKAVVEADPMMPRGGNGKPTPVLDCAGLCGVRCSRHSRPNLCIRACGTCCFRCKCVPPGTSGNREMCGNCYTNMTTHNNRTKCP